MFIDTADPAYRWVIVFAAAAMLAISMGFLVNGLSIFFLPLEVEFSAPRADVALINTVGLVGIALGGIIVGTIADRTDIRKIAIVAALVIGGTTIAAARATSLWQLYFLFFFAGLFGGGALFAPVIAVVGSWFRTGAGLAIGIASAGQGLGQGGVPFGASFLIENLGWRDAMATLGIISLTTLLLLAFLMRQPPAPATVAKTSEAQPLLPTPLVVVSMSVAVLCCCAGMSVPLMHLVPLIQGCGITAPEAGGVLFTLMIAAICGRIVFGQLADMIGAIPAYMTAVAWQTLLMFGFTQFVSLEAFYIYAPIYGFGYGGVMTGVLTTIRALTPAARRASATGIVLAFAWLGHGLGGWQGGLFYDLTHSYNVSFANAAFAGIVNLTVVGCVLLLLRRRQRALA
jgi:MFS family permease